MNPIERIDHDEVEKMHRAITQAIHKAFPPNGGVSYVSAFTVFTFLLTQIAHRAGMPHEEFFDHLKHALVAQEQTEKSHD